MGVSSSESHDLTAFYELLTASFGVLSQNTGFYPSLDRIVETTLRPLNLGPGGGSYNEPISHLHRAPDMFNGSNPEDLQAFLLQCQITFNAHPQNFTSESAKVFFTISYLKKSALEWFEQGILEDDLTQAPEWRSSWTEFVKELQTHFGPTNPIGTVEVELQHLTMTSGAHLSKYLVMFNTLASRVEWGDMVLCFQFYDGLPDQLKDQIALLRKPNNL